MGSSISGKIGTCNQCAADEAIDYCVDCDDNLCGDCRMVDPERGETVCEGCFTDRESAERDKTEGEER